jgi:hypothetical protein
MDGNAIAPRADGLDAVVAFAEFKFCAGEWIAHPRQTVQQSGAVRDDQSDHAAHHVGFSHRQVKLAHADIDPHIARAGVEIRIAGETEPGHVIMRRQMLIADADIDVAEVDDVAGILRRAIVVFFEHWRGSFPD